MMKHPQWSPTDPAVNHYLGVMFATTSACRLLLLTHRRDIAQSLHQVNLPPSYHSYLSPQMIWKSIIIPNIKRKEIEPIIILWLLGHNWVPRNLDLYFYINITKICGLVLKCGTIPMYLRLVHGDFKGCTSILRVYQNSGIEGISH